MREVVEGMLGDNFSLAGWDHYSLVMAVGWVAESPPELRDSHGRLWEVLIATAGVKHYDGMNELDLLDLVRVLVGLEEGALPAPSPSASALLALIKERAEKEPQQLRVGAAGGEVAAVVGDRSLRRCFAGADEQRGMQQ
jgi:hypothetical protein